MVKPIVYRGMVVNSKVRCAIAVFFCLSHLCLT